MKLRHQVFTNFSTKNSKLRGYLKWWSNQTLKHPKRVVPRSVAFFRKNLIFAIFTFHDNQIVSAAGIIWCLHTQNGKEKMHFRGKIVVELGSNIVNGDYEDNGIGTNNTEKRLKFCKKRNYFPVSVTSSDPMKHIFDHKLKNSSLSIAIEMEKILQDYPDLVPIFLGVREPEEKKTIYAFREHLPQIAD
jgi:hypothetical protein